MHAVIQRIYNRAERGDISWEQADEQIAEWADREIDLRKDREMEEKWTSPSSSQTSN